MTTRNTAREQKELAAVVQRIRVGIPAGMTDHRLADEAQIDPHTLARIFSRQRGISTLELNRIAAALGADPHFLLMGTPDPHRLTLVSWHRHDERQGAAS